MPQHDVRPRRRGIWVVTTVVIGLIGAMLIAPQVDAAGPLPSATCRLWDATPGAITLDNELAGTVASVQRSGTDCDTGTVTATFSDVVFGARLVTGSNVTASFTGSDVRVTQGSFRADARIFEGALSIDPAVNGGVLTARSDSTGLTITGGQLTPPPMVRTTRMAAAAPAPAELLPDVLAAAAGQVQFSAGFTESGLAVSLKVDTRVAIDGLIAWDGSYKLSARITDLVIGDPALGTGKLSGTGTISGPNFDVAPTVRIEGRLTGPLGLSKAVNLLDGSAVITNDSIALAGSARLACTTGSITAGLKVDYRAAAQWSAAIDGAVTDGGCTLAEGLVLRSGTVQGTLTGAADGAADGTLKVAGAATVAALPEGLRDWTMTLDGRFAADAAGAPRFSGTAALRAPDASFDGSISDDGRFQLNGSAKVTVLGTTLAVIGSISGASGDPQVDLAGSISARFPVGASVIPGALENLTRRTGVTATQSGTGWNGVPARAIDGTTDGNYYSNSVSHTLNGPGAEWLTIDLGAPVSVDHLVLFHRTDCCTNRSLGGYVYLSDTPFTTAGIAATQAAAGVTTLRIPTTSAASHRFDAKRIARYVRIQTTGTLADDYLSVAEVQVMGRPIAPASTAELTGEVKVGATGNALNGSLTVPCGAGSIRFDLAIPAIDATGAEAKVTGRTEGPCALGGTVIENGELTGALSLRNGELSFSGSIEYAVGGRPVSASITIDKSGISFKGGLALTCLTGGITVSAEGAITTAAGSVQATGTVTDQGCELTPGLSLAPGDSLTGSITVDADGNVTAAFGATGRLTADWLPGGATWNVAATLKAVNGGATTAAVKLTSDIGTFSGTINSDGTFELAGRIKVTTASGVIDGEARLVRSTPDGTPVFTLGGSFDQTGGGVRLQGSVTSEGDGLRVRGTVTISCNPGSITGSVDVPVRNDGTWSVRITGAVASGGCRLGPDANLVSGSVTGLVSSTGAFELSGAVKLRWNGTSVDASAHLARAAGGTPQLTASASVTQTSGLTLAGTLNWSATGVRFTGSATIPCTTGSVTGSINANVSGTDWTTGVALAVAPGGCRVNPQVFLNSGSFNASLTSRSGAMSLTSQGRATITTAGALIPTAPTTYSGYFDLSVANGRVNGNVNLSGGGVTLSGSLSWAGDLNWSVNAAGSLQIRNTTAGFAGRVWRSNGVLGWDLSGQAANVQLSDSMWLHYGAFRWDTQKFALTGQLKLTCSQGDLVVNASGWIQGGNNWWFGANATSSSCVLGKNLWLTNQPFSGWIGSSWGVVNGSFNTSFARWDAAPGVWITNGWLRLDIINGSRFRGSLGATGNAAIQILFCTKEIGATVYANFDLTNRWTGYVQVGLSNIRIGLLSLMFQAQLEVKLRDGAIYGLSV